MERAQGDGLITAEKMSFSHSCNLLKDRRSISKLSNPVTHKSDLVGGSPAALVRATWIDGWFGSVSLPLTRRSRNQEEFEQKHAKIAKSAAATCPQCFA
jgi:hypothetical protein